MNTQKPQTIFDRQPHRGVRQDKDAQERISAGSDQPVRADTPAHMPKKHGSNRRKTVEVAGYVIPSIRAELERIAKAEKLSLSKVVAAFLTQSIQTHKDMQYRSMLEPVIKDQIHKDIQAYSNRISSLAVKARDSAEESRILLIKVLSLLLDTDPQVLNHLIEEAKKEARANVMRDMEDLRPN
jgi:hypothetical protein